ncbi:MAG TPA: VOC family protein [Gemmatimonadaceae bacterium]|nr:VOC family protein [Gemmatimonadaceae bacterium]
MTETDTSGGTSAPDSTRDAPWLVAPSRFHLPADIRLGPVRLQVADLARSLAYYERVLGLRALERAEERAMLGAADDVTPLVELHERPGATPVPRRGRLGLYHYALLLPSRDALGRFVIHLARLGIPVGSADHVVSEALYLTDPDGLGIEVYADRPRGAWRADRGALAMATDPLDVQDLVRVAGDAPWTGAPPGTRVGHVHLHVADLAAAAAFYHDGLGLDRVVLSFPGALFLSAGGYHHHLGTNTWATGAPRAEEGDARLLEWTVEVPDAAAVAAAVRSLAAAGEVVRSEPEAVVAADPWGTRVRVAVRAR